MKKIIRILALCMALLLPLCASAATVTNSHEATGVVYMGAYSKTYVVQLDNGYQIYAADGTPIGPVWPQMGPLQNGNYYKVLNGDIINVVTAQGEMVMTENYFGYASPGSGWILGILMEDTTDENADYTANSGAKMNMLRADIVIDNKLVGSIPRGPYMPTAKTGVIGDYLYALHEDGRCVFFDKNLQVTADITLAEKPTEFMLVDGKYVYTPTQQPAFCAECTLTPDQVTQSVIVDGCNIIGLQGQVIATLPADGHISAVAHNGYVSQYFISGNNAYKSLWNAEGKLLIPSAYDLATEGYTNSNFYLSGYQMTLSAEGDLYCYDKTGAVTAELLGLGLKYTTCMGYMEGSPILGIKSAAGYTLFSATEGLLDGVYEDIEPSRTGAPVAVVCQNGLYGAVALDGTVVVPFEFDDIAVSFDGMLLIGERADGSWGVYNVAY